MCVIFNRVIGTTFTAVFLTCTFSLFRLPGVQWVRWVRWRRIWKTGVWIRFISYFWYRFEWIVMWCRISCRCNTWCRWWIIWWWWRVTRRFHSLSKVAWYGFRRKCTGLCCCRILIMCIPWHTGSVRKICGTVLVETFLSCAVVEFVLACVSCEFHNINCRNKR